MKSIFVGDTAYCGLGNHHFLAKNIDFRLRIVLNCIYEFHLALWCKSGRSARSRKGIDVTMLLPMRANAGDGPFRNFLDFRNPLEDFGTGRMKSIGYDPALCGGCSNPHDACTIDIAMRESSPM